MRVILFLLAFTLVGCSGPMLTVRTIADCPSYRNQAAPQSVKDWLVRQFEDKTDPPPKEAGPWIDRVADNTQALNEACEARK